LYFYICQNFYKNRILVSKTVYLSLGSNSSDRKKYLTKAKVLLEEKIGNLQLESSVYETNSWGYDDKNYLNQVISIQTSCLPFDILAKTQLIEKLLGRKNKSYIDEKGKIIYSSRTIDIDILFYDDDIIKSENLTVPHPNLHLRNFVLVPLNEISPKLVHPILNKEVDSLLKSCEDEGGIGVYL